jgi:hypothetical protein
MENGGKRRHFEDLNNPLMQKWRGTVVEPFGGYVNLGWGLINTSSRDRRFYAVRLPLTSVTRGRFVQRGGLADMDLMPLSQNTVMSSNSL